MSEPPEHPFGDSAPSELPAPTRAPGDTPSGEPTQTTRPESIRTARPAPRGGRGRRVLIIVGAVVVLAIVIGIAVITLGGGDGTKATANPLEIRQLVATFECTASNPGAPSSIKVTAGQEVVRTGQGGCAVVGPVIAKVDRASKVTTADIKGGCTVTFESSSKYGAIVDKASVVTNGYARALVGGGYVLDLRARLSAPEKSAKLTVVFTANDQAACEKVSAALAKT